SPRKGPEALGGSPRAGQTPRPTPPDLRLSRHPAESGPRSVPSPRESLSLRRLCPSPVPARLGRNLCPFGGCPPSLVAAESLSGGTYMDTMAEKNGGGGGGRAGPVSAGGGGAVA
ncbi:unnamed protein product, partial [Coccothraustes coccothraustes]